MGNGMEMRKKERNWQTNKRAFQVGADKKEKVMGEEKTADSYSH